MPNRKTEKKMKTELSPAAACKRCGTCCLNGGPALHLQDKELISSGRLPARDLFTIRAGEPSLDNVRGCIVPAPTDIIKVKSRGPSQGCLYYNHAAAQCTLYEERPVECRLLNCRDTAAIESGYDKDRLTREDLIGGVDGLWRLVSDHQEHCSYTLVRTFADRLKRERDEKAAQEIAALVRYDKLLRNRILEANRISGDMLLFLFGRPLDRTIGMYDLQLVDGRVKFSETAATGSAAGR